MRKKQGVIMLEVLILLNILVVLIVYNSKTIIANSSKYECYEIRDDILYISELEYELLCEVKEELEKNEELMNYIKAYKEDLTISYNYSFTKNQKLKFIIMESKMYLREELGSGTESIREIDVIFINHDENIEIIFMPKLYKLFYMKS